jgi:hypothetical protein
LAIKSAPSALTRSTSLPLRSCRIAFKAVVQDGTSMVALYLGFSQRHSEQRRVRRLQETLGCLVHRPVAVGSKDGHLVFIERHGRPDDIW